MFSHGYDYIAIPLDDINCDPVVSIFFCAHFPRHIALLEGVQKVKEFLKATVRSRAARQIHETGYVK